MKAIILAGGFGTRIAAISNGLPKPLLGVAGKPILQHQIEFLRDNGIGNIRLSLHYRAGQIIEFCERMWPGELEFTVEKEPLGTGGAVKLASHGFAPHEEFLVLNCDNLMTGIDFPKFFSSGAPTIGCVWLEDAREYGLVEVVDGRVRAFREKPQEKTPGYVSCGWYLLRRDAFDAIESEGFMLEREVFPRLAAAGALRAYAHRGWWIDAGTQERLQRANNDYLTRDCNNEGPRAA
jgi:NDP-sugar pyrophosphorylase family protein